MHRDIVIESVSGEVRAALLEDDLVSEVFIERPGRRAITGNVYKGRVTTVLPGMQSAFVDIGLERDAFLYVEDVAVDPESFERFAGDDTEEVPAGPAPGSITSGRAVIEDLLREGQDIVVQATKDPLPQKGARITSHAALPGRFLVYLPAVPHIGVSRRIEGIEERERLRTLVGRIAADLRVTGGFIVRTAGEGQDDEEFRADAAYLRSLWEEIRRRGESRGAPSLLHAEVGAVARVLRDVLHRDVERVTVDTEAVLREALDFVGRVQPSLAQRIHLHAGTRPLFEDRGIEVQLDRALRPRVWLKSGGSIVIQPTEALVAVDVNTGKYVGKRRLEETILTTNLEAAREIARQVRLRDLGGIIVIDFIDMQEAAGREQVMQTLETELRRDRARSRLQPISPFGLVEITRQRSRPSLERTLCGPCPECTGTGRVKTAETVYFEIVRAVRRARREAQGTVVVRVNPVSLESLRRALREFEPASGEPPLLGAALRADPDLRQDQFVVESS